MQPGKSLDFPRIPFRHDCFQDPTELNLTPHVSGVSELDSQIMWQSFEGKLQLKHNTHYGCQALEITVFEGIVTDFSPA